jgi:adenylosuccinate synthase
VCVRVTVVSAIEVVSEKQVRAWEDLPEAARRYIARVEELVGVKCRWIGVGPGRDAIVVQPTTSGVLAGKR